MDSKIEWIKGPEKEFNAEFEFTPNTNKHLGQILRDMFPEEVAAGKVCINANGNFFYQLNLSEEYIALLKETFFNVVFKPPVNN